MNAYADRYELPISVVAGIEIDRWRRIDGLLAETYQLLQVRRLWMTRESKERLRDIEAELRTLESLDGRE